MITKLALPRWHHVIIELYRKNIRPKYSQRLNRKIKGSINHLRQIVRMLSKKGLVRIIPSNKIKHLELTKRGEKVASAILEIKAELS